MLKEKKFLPRHSTFVAIACLFLYPVSWVRAAGPSTPLTIGILSQGDCLDGTACQIQLFLQKHGQNVQCIDLQHVCPKRDDDTSGPAIDLKEFWAREDIFQNITPENLQNIQKKVQMYNLNKHYLETQFRGLDGLILPGNYYNTYPPFYNQESDSSAEFYDSGHAKSEYFLRRTAAELASLSYAQKNQIPVLGVCGGMEIMNVFSGGRLRKFSQNDGDLGSRQDKIHVHQNSQLYHLLQLDEIPAWRSHSVYVEEEDLGKNLNISAKFDKQSSIVEAFEGTGEQFFWGLQFHPEMLYDQDGSNQKILVHFLTQSQIYHDLKRDTYENLLILALLPFLHAETLKNLFRGNLNKSLELASSDEINFQLSDSEGKLFAPSDTLETLIQQRDRFKRNGWFAKESIQWQLIQQALKNFSLYPNQELFHKSISSLMNDPELKELIQSRKEAVKQGIHWGCWVSEVRHENTRFVTINGKFFGWLEKIEIPTLDGDSITFDLRNPTDLSLQEISVGKLNQTQSLIINAPIKRLYLSQVCMLGKLEQCGNIQVGEKSLFISARGYLGNPFTLDLVMTEGTDIFLQLSLTNANGLFIVPTKLESFAATNSSLRLAPIDLKTNLKKIDLQNTILLGGLNPSICASVEEIYFDFSDGESGFDYTLKDFPKLKNAYIKDPKGRFEEQDLPETLKEKTFLRA